MKSEMLLKAGGIYHLICAILHLFFPKMFNWKNALKPLHEEIRPVINANLQIMNICLLVFWVVFAILPFFYSHELLSTAMGKMLLTSIVIFWAIRIFILQPVYVGLTSKITWKMISFFMIGFILFTVPFFRVVHL